MLRSYLKKSINDLLAINEHFYIYGADGKTLITDIKMNISIRIFYNALGRDRTSDAAPGKY